MSKQELQQAALENGGVSYDESLEAEKMTPSLYERIGHDGFVELSTRFYDNVFNDKDAIWFLNIFSSSTKDEAIENQYRYLIQTFGGPDLYRQKKGKYTRLAGRHANYNIGTRAAHQWLHHMTAAIDAHDKLDAESKTKLTNYFRYTAHYLVAAMTYMRPDQLSGGTQVDYGRVW
jgi:truncated hemoglobin YjbI